MENRFKVNQAANLANIGTLVNEAIFAFDENTDGARDIIFDIHSMIYPNSARPATTEENAALAAQEPPAWTPCQSGDCDPVCNICDEGKYVTKKALSEIKLLNLKSYSRLIGCALEDTATGETCNIPKDWRVMSGDTWNDCFLMLSHINDTLAELLPV